MATLGGNIGSASPIGDLLPLMMAYGATLKLRSENAERYLPVEDFIAGYRKTNLKKDELITEIIIQKQDFDTKIFSHKISKRRTMDISSISGAFRLTRKHGIVHEIILAFGGMAETPKRAVQTETSLLGKEWSRKNIEEAMVLLCKEFTPISDARAEAEFRTAAAKNLLLKFFLETN
jgi:xanthine dehydrogenase small subunit